MTSGRVDHRADGAVRAGGKDADKAREARSGGRPCRKGHGEDPEFWGRTWGSGRGHRSEPEPTNINKHRAP